jgi:hypothetical protein
MPTPAEYKTIQARILAYAQEIGWTYVPRGEAEKRRGFDHSKATPAEQAAEASPYFDDLLDAQVRMLNPKYADGRGALVGDLRRLHADIAGNRDFLAHVRRRPSRSVTLLSSRVQCGTIFVATVELEVTSVNCHCAKKAWERRKRDVATTSRNLSLEPCG